MELRRRDGVRCGGSVLNFCFIDQPASLLLGAAERLVHTVFISEQLQPVAALFGSLAARHVTCIPVTQEHGAEKR